jgi:hypothetical protein
MWMKERLALALFAVLALALRVLCVVRYRVDSDEAQHLHVAWLWSRGLVGYRDFYDNHTPLFHVLTSPFIAALGDTPDIFLFGRLMMVPLAAASLFLIYRIGERLFDARTASWAVLGAATGSPLLLKSIEFRNDNLWLLLSLAALLLALAPLTPRRAAFLGAIVALSVLASIKSVFFALALAIVIVAVDGFGISLVAGAIGFLAPLIAAIAWFAAHDALDDLVWCAIEINRLLPVSAARLATGAGLAALTTALVLLWLRSSGANRAVRIGAGTIVLFTALVAAFAPMLSPRDFLPTFAMIAVFGAGALAMRPVWLPIAVATLMAFAYFDGRLWREPDRYQERLIAEALALSHPSEPILDLKGETVFRPRPSYIALEDAGRNALALGAIRETFIKDVVSRPCYIATRDADFFPIATREFLRKHFVAVGELRVAGAYARPDGTFSIAIPGHYAAVGANGTVLDRDRWYEPGIVRAGVPAAVLLWAPAVQRGFLPTVGS